VSLWVKGINDQCADGSDNPILLYKPQGVEPEGELQGSLNKEDFCVCIQTSFQRDMLIKLGTAAVCMDSTHGTNVYDFNLTTLLVLDEFGEGIPVAWMVCNREDAVALKPFLKKVKEKCGDVCTNFFMSDDANNFYNAWKDTFSVSNTKKLLCAWHIDKSWRKGLHQHVVSSTEQANVYHYLRVLLVESDINSFQHRLQQFISWLSSENLTDFLQYFQREYVKKVEQWAPCYRERCSVNTNMALEAFHRLIKVCYMEKKQNRRIDFLLHLLLKIARDKIFERLQKTQKGKSSYRLCEINKRHRTAQKMSMTDILLANSNLWKIKPSVSSRCDPYLVKKQLDSCSCHLRCSTCDVCVHMYSCTCMDYLIHSTVCKHIHLVNIHQSPSNECHFEHQEALGSGEENQVLQGCDEECLLQESDEINSSITVNMPMVDTLSVDTLSVDYLSSQLIGKTVSDLEKQRENVITICKKNRSCSELLY